jgi:hypothetical protein
MPIMTFLVFEECTNHHKNHYFYDYQTIMIKENVIEKEMYKLRIKIDALNNKVNT